MASGRAGQPRRKPMHTGMQPVREDRQTVDQSGAGRLK